MDRQDIFDMYIRRSMGLRKELKGWVPRISNCDDFDEMITEGKCMVERFDRLNDWMRDRMLSFRYTAIEIEEIQKQLNQKVTLVLDGDNKK